jgi:hypothetical protein
MKIASQVLTTKFALGSPVMTLLSQKAILFFNPKEEYLRAPGLGLLLLGRFNIISESPIL